MESQYGFSIQSVSSVSDNALISHSYWLYAKTILGGPAPESEIDEDLPHGN